MQPGNVVEGIDVVSNLGSRFGSGLEGVLIECFPLDGGEKALCAGFHPKGTT
jgi:hypothetical protein